MYFKWYALVSYRNKDNDLDACFNNLLLVFSNFESVIYYHSLISPHLNTCFITDISSYVILTILSYQKRDLTLFRGN